MREAENLTDALPTFLDHVLSAFDLSAGEISLYDAKSNKLQQKVSLGWFKILEPFPTPPNEGVSGKVFSSGQPYFSDEFVLSDQVLPSMREKIPPGWGGVCVPLRSNKTIVGVLFVSSQLPRRISPQEVRLLESLADIAGSTFHRIRLLEETRKDARQMAIINKVGKLLSESLELDEIYERLQEAILGLIPKTSTVIFSLFDPEREMIVPVYAHHAGQRQDIATMKPIPLEPMGYGLQSHAIRTRLPVISNQFRKDMKEKVKTVQNIRTGGPDTQSSLYVPMLAKDRVVGVINLQSFEMEYFIQEHADILSVIGNSAAFAIENARLFKQNWLRLQRLKSLRTIDISITDSPNLDYTLEVILEQIENQLKVDAGVILVLNRSRQTLEFGAGRGFRTPALQNTKLKIGEGYAGQAALQRSLVEVRDLEHRKTDFLRSPTFSSEGFKVYFGIPLIAKNDVQGVLEVFLRTPFQPDAEWLDFLEALAGQAAIAIDSAKLFKDLEASNTNLVHAYDETIEGWSRAMDLRDEETEGHTRRVTEITLHLSQVMGISAEQLVQIRRGALLHDIGKMGVPDHILLKPGKLTDDEWIIMRKHPDFAYEMLSKIEYLIPALDIPYSHHEKWDGSGYPNGLKGTDIPLAARIFAIADVYDALTSDRPYRSAWSEERAIDYICSQSGTHFDPEVVRAFLQLEEKTLPGMNE